MNKDHQNKRDHKDNNPTSPDRKEINPANRNWEASRNPDSDNDRTGRNVDIDQKNQENEIIGREQQTTPKNKVQDIVNRFSRKEEQNRDRE